ncbi:MAG TPA: alanine--tRNA ligase, partial [Chthoniobacterales bacterium]|nr:alanine--tRNA ligase [Chthoniobacterales bacterium]
SDTRAADTQKCIRAGGKHNDLEDVGLDTYHHTFFEMLGNWSFGDYFKKEAIEWAWELIVDRWKFPVERLYATVYSPAPGDPSEFDQEAYDYWAALFSKAGLDPKAHIVNGNKKDNFWMMGDTGPCGPCSELHVDLTPAGDTKGSLVNAGDARCIEIWNLVFIQFNANPDGTFSPLPARHVDTGMGFERVTSILQGTKNFSDFANAKISNYSTDIFRPIFDELEKISGCTYTNTLPVTGSTGDTPQEKIDVAFRVIADHIRTLSFAIADGIQPGNTDRNYVLRRILRRAVRYGRTLGLHEPFFFKLVDVLARTMGGVFHELRLKQKHVEEVIRREEEAFNKTLDRGIKMFETEVFESALAAAAQADGLAMVVSSQAFWVPEGGSSPTEVEVSRVTFSKGTETIASFDLDELLAGGWKKVLKTNPRVSGSDAFKLYDTYGFPLDLTELMARERGLSLDHEGFEQLMEAQRDRARAAQKKEVITAEGQTVETVTQFVGYDQFSAEAQLVDVVSKGDDTFAVVDVSPLYAEMGGQLGDTGTIVVGGEILPILNTVKRGGAFFLKVAQPIAAPATVHLSVDLPRRAAIQRHHTVTHLLHWALHEVVSKEATQKGSFVGPDKLTFDFNSAALTPEQLRDIEKLVNERIVENAAVSWIEAPYSEVKTRGDIMQFFGDKYGDTVRVVQIGGRPEELDGYSMELCGGTHTRATGEIGVFRIVNEAAIAAGVRRIEATAGLPAYEAARADMDRLAAISGKLNAPLAELEKKLEAPLTLQKTLEKQISTLKQKQAAGVATELLEKIRSAGLKAPAIIENLGDADGDYLQAVADALKGRFKGVTVLAGAANGAVALVASVSAEHAKSIQAGKIIQAIAPVVDGKGGGRPDNARGGGKDASKIGEALAAAEKLLAS